MTKLPPKRILLDQNWSFRTPDSSCAGPAIIPGTIHLDLLRTGLIDDPFIGMNERNQAWIAETIWIYQTSFDLTPSEISEAPFDLVCEGLDTLATVRLNEIEVGNVDNMFRTWRWSLPTNLLRERGNALEITFAPALVEGRKRQSQDPVRTSDDGAFRLIGGQWIRKEQCNFGWDWGPQCVTCGIWKPLYLEPQNAPRLVSAKIRHPTIDARRATLEVTPVVTSAPSGATIEVTLHRHGKIVAVAHSKAADDTPLHLDISDPEQWWPNGWGTQPLYELGLTLRDPKGNPLDHLQRRMGLRTIDLVREEDSHGRSFFFRVNGQRIFAKGANWIPADVFAPRLSPEKYRHLLESARDAGMNMIRVWGGGIYEPDLFYDLCDELGLLVWQDFMFACSAYPAHDQEWLHTVEIEATEQCERLHHHACLALWCGNNEIEQFEFLIKEQRSEGAMSRNDYRLLFEERLPAIVSASSPDSAYWPGSPHSEDGAGANDDRTGDRHFWNVWWGLEPFESFAHCEPRFCSEFGFQSFPSWETLQPCLTPDQYNLSSPTMDHLQRGNTRLGTGNGTILAYLSANFRLPSDFRGLLRVSQILQGWALQRAVQAWRGQTPRCQGTLYWQLNDCWPGPSWSTIDYEGRWKASHYFAQRFFAPHLIWGRILPEDGLLEVVFISDHPPSGDVEITLTITTPEGTIVDERQQSVHSSNDQPVRLSFPMAETLARVGPDCFMCWIEARTGEQLLAEELVLAVKPKHLALVEPGIVAEPVENLEEPTVRLSARRGCALWAWLDSSDATERWRTNFLHLRPGQERLLTYTGKKLPCYTVSSLHATYQ